MTVSLGPHWRSAALLGAVVGLLGVTAGLVPWVARMEDRAGLPWLFSLRGPRPAPPGITIVSIDEETSAILDLPPDPADWPRTAFASLVDALRSARSRLIVLDVFFPDGQASPDTEELARAMSRAGNVLISARLSKEVLAIEGSGGGAVRIGLQEPDALLADAAIGVAPFPLPVVPVQISQFWAFHAGAGDMPTLPAMTAHAAAAGALAKVRRLVADKCPGASHIVAAPPPGPSSRQGAADAMRDARSRWQRAPDSCLGTLRRATFAATGQVGAGDLSAATLLRLYAGPSSYYLNYYGPPRSFPTIAFQDVVRAPRNFSGALRDQIVFVGFAARDQVGQEDSFYTVFSDDSGLNLSGVEIAATATANLLAGDVVRPLWPLEGAGLALLWGLALGIACRLLPGAPGVAAGAVGAGAYVLAAQWLLARFNVWIPVMVPIFLQAPLAVLGGLFMQYRQAGDQRTRIAAALGRYVPPQMVDRLAEEGLSASTRAENVHGTCMATDASQYTLMAETLAPDEVGAILNTYFDILFTEVDRHGGAVSDIVGDAMMAIWVSTRPGSGIEQQACQAAVRILAELQARLATGDRAALPTRIGLHSGTVRWGAVGARGHLAYRAVGDIVNTASRIEGLNKRLGTRVLASEETLAGVDGIRARPVGRFLLAGKSLPVALHELLGTDEMGADEARLRLFAEALSLFQAGKWRDAGPLFLRCQQQSEPADPVASFYAGLCAHYRRYGPHSFANGAVIIEGK